MKVKMLTLSASPEGVFHPGDQREISEEKGKQMIQGNYAVEVVGKKESKETDSKK